MGITNAALGRLLHRLGAPGFVEPWEYHDQATGLFVAIRTSPRYTILTVDAMEFFFIRETGKFDGTGTTCADSSMPTSLYCTVVDDIQQSARSRVSAALLHHQ